MKEPKVSVCIDSFNYARFLPEAIESVLQQTFADYEVVVCDDCSTDDSFAIAERYARRDPRIRPIRNPRNLGMIGNRNAALAAARGEFVKTLHADDFLISPEALARMMAPLESNPAVVLVASARCIVDERSSPLETWSSFGEKRPLAGVTVINRCLFEQRNLIGGPSAVMFRRAAAGRGFSQDFFVMADLEMWFHLLEHGCFAYIAEPLCAFRQHTRQQTERDLSSLAPALENRELLRRYLPKPYVRLRRWITSYLNWDAVRRVVRRSRKLGRQSEAEAAVNEYGGARKFRADAPLNRYRETLLKLRRIYERHLRRPLPQPREPLPAGINMAGFVQSVYGIGESSRAMWQAVQATGLPCVLINVRSTVHRNTDLSHRVFAVRNPYRVNLMTFSFDYSRRFYRDMGPRFFAGRYNIGLWYWEQERFPARWHSAFDYYDEIWVASEFTRQSLAAVSPVPVRKITYPFSMDDQVAADRAGFGLAPDDYVFLFNFDFMSTVARKNPGAVIDAFRQVFQPEEPAVLVLKSINQHYDLPARVALAARAQGARVLFLDEHLSGAQMNALFASCDCYVSLHRSEGLGLGMAQAMFLGKPVIGTGYSGNLEFMTTQNSLLVNYQLVEFEDEAGPYEPGSHWADPDINHAAELMRWTFTNRDRTQALGVLGADDIRRLFDPRRTAAEIEERIREVANSC